VQEPVSGLPEIAPAPTAVTLPAKPLNGAVGAVHVVVDGQFTAGDLFVVWLTQTRYSATSGRDQQ